MKKQTIKATHVLILGSVFPWEAKAPYTESGRLIDELLRRFGVTNELALEKWEDEGGSLS